MEATDGIIVSVGLLRAKKAILMLVFFYLIWFGGFLLKKIKILN